MRSHASKEGEEKDVVCDTKHMGGWYWGHPALSCSVGGCIKVAQCTYVFLVQSVLLGVGFVWSCSDCDVLWSS